MPRGSRVRTPNIQGALREVVKQVSARTGYPLEEAAVICDEFMQVLLERVRHRRSVRIPGLGTFAWIWQAERSVRHPKTHEIIHVPRRERLRFIASQDMNRKGEV